MNLNELTEKIIGAAIEVHRHLGPGLLEATYEAALCVELDILGLRHERQRVVPVIYRGRNIGSIFWLRTPSSLSSRAWNDTTPSSRPSC